MADIAIDHRRQPCGRRRAKGAQQIVRIQLQVGFFHPCRLSKLGGRVRSDDKTIKELLKLDGDELESYILAALGLSGDLKNSINEFLRFRMHFQDGNVPDDALAVPKAAMLTSYAKVMHRCLDGLVGRKGAFKVSHQIEPDYGVGIVLAQFSDEDTSFDDSVLRDICAKAVDFYRESSSNSFNNSLSITFDAATTTVCMTKPLEFFRWTIDSAYTDSRNVMNAFVKG